jgi:DnaJ-class molecular chaperone
MSCSGSGKENEKCVSCNGYGQSVKNDLIEIEIFKDGSTNAPSNIMLTLTVKSNDKFTIEGRNVVSKAKIDLVTAMLGGSIEVDTILGNKKLKIKEKTKHLDKIRAAGLGIFGGDHIFVIEVEYPEDISEFVSKLKDIG